MPRTTIFILKLITIITAEVHQVLSTSTHLFTETRHACVNATLNNSLRSILRLLDNFFIPLTTAVTTTVG